MPRFFRFIGFIRPQEEFCMYFREVTPPLMFAKQLGWRQAGPDRRARNQPAHFTRVGLIRRGHRHW